MTTPVPPSVAENTLPPESESGGMLGAAFMSIILVPSAFVFLLMGPCLLKIIWMQGERGLTYIQFELGFGVVIIGCALIAWAFGFGVSWGLSLWKDGELPNFRYFIRLCLSISMVGCILAVVMLDALFLGHYGFCRSDDQGLKMVFFDLCLLILMGEGAHFICPPRVLRPVVQFRVLRRRFIRWGTYGCFAALFVLPYTLAKIPVLSGLTICSGPRGGAYPWFALFGFFAGVTLLTLWDIQREKEKR